MSDYETKVLAALEGRGAFLTRDVAAKVRPLFGGSQHTHSGAVRSWLVCLERAGLVEKLDGEKPVCWKLKEKT